MSLVVAVIGSRTYADYERVAIVLDRLAPTKIVSGGAIGADSLAARYAKERSIPLEEFLPDWRKGRGAGLERNTRIIDAADIITAFWDGKSKGTADGIAKAEARGKRVILTLAE